MAVRLVRNINIMRSEYYEQAMADIVTTFQRTNMLDLRGGTWGDPALVKAASTGNFWMCKQLLAAGASTPPSVILTYPPPGIFLETGESAMDG